MACWFVHMIGKCVDVSLNLD